MPTYAQLAREPQWLAEFEAGAHAAFNERLRKHYGHTRSQTGSKGDNRHLEGRHRSRNWALNSRYCTDRSYGTRDPRDRAGNGDWLRATDVGITGAEHRAASKRLDTAVRAGQLPAVAEWFGSFDGRTVVGWFEGQPGTSDISHLRHLHVGLWNQFCNHVTQLRLLGDVITGAKPAPTPPPIEEDDMPQLLVRLVDLPAPDRDQIWLADGRLMRRVSLASVAGTKSAAKVLAGEIAGDGPVSVAQCYQPGLLGPLSHDGRVYQSKREDKYSEAEYRRFWGVEYPTPLAADDLDEVAKAAAAGAALGAGSGTITLTGSFRGGPAQ